MLSKCFLSVWIWALQMQKNKWCDEFSEIEPTANYFRHVGGKLRKEKVS